MLYILICLGAAERPRNAAGLTPLGHALSWGAEEMIIFELGLLLGTACIWQDPTSPCTSLLVSAQGSISCSMY